MAFQDEPLVEPDAVALSIWMLRGFAAPSLTMPDEVAEYKSTSQSREYILGLLAD